MLNCIFLLGIGIPQEYNRLHDKGGEIIKVSIRYVIVLINGIFYVFECTNFQTVSVVQCTVSNVHSTLFRPSIYIKKVPQMSRDLRFVNDVTNKFAVPRD